MKRRAFIKTGFLFVPFAPTILRGQGQITGVGSIGGVGTIGPSVGGGAFDPTQISNMKFWYQPGSDCHILGGDPCGDGDSVITWVDKAGNGNLLDSSASGLIYNTGVKNSLPAVKLGGTGGPYFYRDTWASGTITQPATFYVVAQAAAAGAYAFIIDGPDGSNRNAIFTNSSDQWQCGAGSWIGSAASVNNTYYIVCAVINGVSSAIYVSSKTANATGDSGSNDSTGCKIGASNAGNLQWGERYIGDFIGYSGAHDATQRSNMFDWLSSRWDISLS